MTTPRADPPDRSQQAAEGIYHALKDQQFRDWLSITPVVNLKIDRTHVRTGEVKIAGVLLMDLKRFQYVAKRRWGKAGVSLRSAFRHMFLQPYERLGSARPSVGVVAVQRGKQRGRDLEDNFLGNVRRALAFLASAL